MARKHHRPHTRDAGTTAVATSARARVMLVLGGVCFAFAVAEIAARVVLPAPPKPRITEPAGVSPFQMTPKGASLYRPGSSFTHIYDVAADRRRYFGGDGRVEYRINNLGFRGEDITVEKPPATRRILCLGDSFTFGEGVREEDAWPQRLGRLLGPGNQVVNAGVQGHDFDSEAVLLLVHGRQLQPDVVVIGFFMNDAMPLAETVAHHQPAPVDHARSALGRVSALWGMLEQRQAAASRTARYLGDLRASFRTERWRDSRGRMAKLRVLADRDGFGLVAVIFPLLHDLRDYALAREHEEVRSAFAVAGIESVDMLDVFRGYDAEDLWVHPVDPHPNEVAHGLAAERVKTLVDGRQLLSPSRRSPR